MNEAIFIGLGSNLGNREENIHAALRLLKEKMRLISVSSLYETEPMYVKDQPLFLNCVAKFESNLEPEEILAYLKEIEARLGRQKGTRYGPRTIDLDLLFYGNRIVEEEFLKIPHPLIRERPFVLAPLAEIAPDCIHPIYKKTIENLLKDLLPSSQSVRKLGSVNQ
jgi:2-amino-4-hydroxy-6-hydroxymethyldihydropteridine diphosphokinase